MRGLEREQRILSTSRMVTFCCDEMSRKISKILAALPSLLRDLPVRNDPERVPGVRGEHVYRHGEQADRQDE